MMRTTNTALRWLAAGLLVAGQSLPVLAQAPVDSAPAATADRGTPATSTTAQPQLPELPSKPIHVPHLPQDADKATLLQAYYDLTGKRVFARALDAARKPPAGLVERAAQCPAAKEVMERFFAEDRTEVLTRIFAEVEPELITALGQRLTESDLRAYLRFAATPDGQRHLNGMNDRSLSSEKALLNYQAYERDPGLRSFARHFSLVASHAGDIIGSIKFRLFFDTEFAAEAKAAFASYEELLKECAKAMASNVDDTGE